jgi:dTDP-4-dehydrorhamnose reductase
VINVAASGEATWHSFATAIAEGLKVRGVPLRVQNVRPIRTQDYPIKARRPSNSRLDLTRLQRVFGIETPRWEEALAAELDKLAPELLGRRQASQAGVSRILLE